MELIIKHLQKSFEKKEVLKDISFTFKPGKIYGLLGRNGAGKTTLFNCLNQDITIDKGIVLLQENNQQRTLEIEDIGYVLSTPTVPSLDVVVAEEMKNVLRHLKEDRILILSTHIMELALDLCDEIVILNHGKLQEVSKDQLDNDEFKDKILAMLREEDYA